MNLFCLKNSIYILTGFAASDATPKCANAFVASCCWGVLDHNPPSLDFIPVLVGVFCMFAGEPYINSVVNIHVNLWYSSLYFY